MLYFIIPALLILVIFVFNIFTTGFATHHIYQIGGIDGREQGNRPSTEWAKKTIHSLFWGAVRQDIPIINCQLGNGKRLGIEEVKIETNFLHLLVSVISLGFWVPFAISWRCVKPPVQTDFLD
jgi:hypothetical protein